MTPTGPPGGWDDFLARHWEREPVLFRAPFAQPFATERELFALLVGAAAGWREATTGLRYYAESGLITSAVEANAFAPTAADATLDGWSERLRARLGGRDFGLVLNDAQACDVALFGRARRFLRGLVERVGLSSQNDATVFAGHYRTTPFGLHADPYGNFLFMATRKRIHVWPRDLFERYPEARGRIDCRDLIPEARTFDGEAGDLLYVPSNRPHVAEADGLSVHISLIVGTDGRKVLELVQRRCDELLRAAISPSPPALFRVVPGRAELPPALAALAAALTDDGALHRSLREAWAAHVSATGFTRVPDRRAPIALGDDDRVAADPDSPIVVELEGTDAVCAAYGHALALPAHPAVRTIAERLNTGRPERVGDLLDAHAGVVEVDGVEYDADRQALRELLEALYAMRAIERV
jgi:50S ribosomal protein L16 3-hydroxylase